MGDFLPKVSILRDSLVATGETMKESVVILIVLSALGDEYESFVTSITTRFDLAMIFFTLCKLLIDYEVRFQESRRSTMVNIVTKSYKSDDSSYKSDDSSMSSYKSSDSSSGRIEVRCKIYNRKGNFTLNYYCNRLNIKKFKRTHS